MRFYLELVLRMKLRVLSAYTKDTIKEFFCAFISPQRVFCMMANVIRNIVHYCCCCCYFVSTVYCPPFSQFMTYEMELWWIVAGWLVCFKRISKLFDPISMIIIQIGATFYKQTHTHQKPSPCAYFSVESAFVVLICWFTFSVHFSHNNSTTVANNSF